MLITTTAKATINNKKNIKAQQKSWAAVMW